MIVLTRHILALAIVFVVALVVWRRLRLLLIVAALLLAGLFAFEQWKRWRAVRRFRAHWQPQGKDLLLVYSNSPNWQTYVEQTWLPKWQRRAVLLNWSERRNWNRERPEVALFHVFATEREFNPLGIVVPRKGRHVHIVRFWRAFRDFKHGKDGLLREAENELERRLTHQAPR